MKDDFTIHNLFWNDVKQFEKLDPHLSRLNGLPYIYRPSIEEKIPLSMPGIYILTGGRQVGKSTLLKLIIKHTLKKGHLRPHQIFYLPCDTIGDYRQLLFEIDQFKTSIEPDQEFILMIDEITYVREWDRAIKSLADEGFFRGGSVLITGSDSFILKEAMMRFPGRRGESSEQDFHLFPLSFAEYVTLKNKKVFDVFEGCREAFKRNIELVAPKVSGESFDALDSLFGEYLITGGFMPAINGFAMGTTILPSVYKTYVQWIVGDMLKRGKQELYLREIIESIIPRLSSQITWHNLVSGVSFEHHQTVAEYAGLLGRMDVLVVLSAIREDKLAAAPKKAKKICFSDPFIFHALRCWVKGNSDPFSAAVRSLKERGGLLDALTEGVVAALFSRSLRTFYIKAEGEVDLAVVKAKNFLPIEVKNSHRLNRNDLKQILKYQRGIIGYAGKQIGKFENADVVPIPMLALLA